MRAGLIIDLDELSSGRVALCLLAHAWRRLGAGPRVRHHEEIAAVVLRPVASDDAPHRLVEDEFVLGERLDGRSGGLRGGGAVDHGDGALLRRVLSQDLADDAATAPSADDELDVDQGVAGAELPCAVSQPRRVVQRHRA